MLRSDFGIASGSFGAEGIVVEMDGKCSPFLWDCQWWSDFHEEAECLFLGGLIAFSVQSIRHIPSRTNYKRYIAPMYMLSRMLEGYHYLLRLATERDVNRLRELITEQIGEKHALSLPSETDRYILSLFHYFCVNVKEVVINMDWMRTDQWVSKKRMMRFGYKIFRSLFFEKENAESLKIKLFLDFLPHLERFIVFDHIGRYVPSIFVNEDFLQRAVRVIEYVNGHKSLSKSFQGITVVRPKMEDSLDIGKTAEKYNYLFSGKGWRLKEITYRHSGGGGEVEAISIERD